VKTELSEIKEGSYIGVTAMPEPDGTQRAIAVHIFPENQRGAAEGFRPWDARANSTMTNATVSQTIKGTDGQNITVKYKDGEKKVVVPPDTPIVTFVASDRSEVKPGAKLIIFGAAKKDDGTLEANRVNVGRDELRTSLVELFREIIPDVPTSLHRDHAVGEIVGAPSALCRRLDRSKDAVRCDRGRIAGTSSKTAHVVGLHMDIIHVSRARADVFGRDVPATEAFDKAAVRAENHFAIRRLVVADDHRLSATEVETGDGVLVRHPAREAQCVDDGLLIARVVPKASPAEGRSKHGAMHGDDAAISRRRILAQHELLVAHLGDRIEELHMVAGCSLRGCGCYRE